MLLLHFDGRIKKLRSSLHYAEFMNQENDSQQWALDCTVRSHTGTFTEALYLITVLRYLIWLCLFQDQWFQNNITGCGIHKNGNTVDQLHPVSNWNGLGAFADVQFIHSMCTNAPLTITEPGFRTGTNSWTVWFLYYLVCSWVPKRISNFGWSKKSFLLCFGRF